MAKHTSTFGLSGSYNEHDQALVRAMAGGEVEALNDLYARYGTTLLLYLIANLDDRQLAEEVLQDVMLAAWRGAARFRHDSSVKTWLLAIARHQASNARTRRRPTPLPLEPTWSSSESGPEHLTEQALAGQALQAALRQLPQVQQETLKLLFYQDLSQAEVAEVMKVAPGTVKSRLARARGQLRKLLKGEGTFDE